MRVVLVFPPRASATYVPLGIASLAAFIASAVPGTGVRLADLNIDTWIRLANADPHGQDLMDFVRGKTGTFTDPGQTLSIKPVWDRLRRQMSLLCRQAETFVATGEADTLFLSLLGSHTRQIMASDPELVCISVLFPEQMPFAAALARTLRQAMGKKSGTRCRVVMGGAMMSALSVQDLLTAVPEIDAVVSGEGEDAVAALCTGIPFSDISGLTFRQENEIRTNPKSPAISLKNLAAPDFSQLPLDAYFNPVPVLPVLFSRGCAWRKCRFCSHNFSFGGYRRKPVEAFVSELAEYQRTLGACHFYSADEYILPRDMDAICEEILARGLKISFHILGKPTADCTPGSLALWSAAGCRWIGWGIESGSQRLLDLVNKGTCVRDVQTVLKDSAAAGISNLGLMIFGLPTSTDQDLDQTLAFLSDAYDSLDGLTASAFVLFDNTHFARNAYRYGMHIDGPGILINSGSSAVRSTRLKFRELASSGSLRLPRGALEVSRWQRYRRWLGEVPLLEQLPPEHWLIHVSGRWLPAVPALPFSSDTETA
ncbi:MAG: radical SAM protein [Desulfotignum sp.]|nr:radical SAM protein [Desulfotignum sp.]